MKYLISIYTLMVLLPGISYSQQWSGSSDLNGILWRNSDIKVNGLQMGRYGSSIIGDSNPYHIFTDDNQSHDLLLFGSNNATLNLRLYDGDLKLGANQNPNAILYNNGRLHLFSTENVTEGLHLQHSNTKWVRMYAPNLSGGAFNNITNNGDAGLIFGTIAGINTADYGFVIAPHRTGASGLRITSTGKIGMGVMAPKAQLEVYDGTSDRGYQINRILNADTEDGQGVNYLLLHTLHTGASMDDHYVMGKISGIRGGTQAWNRKWTVDVNTSSAYQSNRGSLITYNEGARLVTLTHQGQAYLAIEIRNGSSISAFSFTGYARNEKLEIVADQAVSSVAAFSQLDPVILNCSAVGIGTSNPDEALTVKGKIHTEEVRVDMTVPGPDYVFEPSYNLLPLSEVESYIKANKHLPEVPSAKQMEEEGLNLKEMNLLLLKKVEELTLHLIEMKKENETMNNSIKVLKTEVQTLRSQQ